MSHTLLGVCTAWPCPMGYPSLVPGGAIGQSLEGGLLLNIRKLFTKQALERSEQNFVTKLNHVPHLAWGLYYMSMPKGLPKPGPRGRYRPKPEGKCTIEYWKVVHESGSRKK